MSVFMTLKLCTLGKWSETHCTDCTDCSDRSRAENNKIWFHFYFCFAGKQMDLPSLDVRLSDYYDLHALSRVSYVRYRLGRYLTIINLAQVILLVMLLLIMQQNEVINERCR